MYFPFIFCFIRFAKKEIVGWELPIETLFQYIFQEEFIFSDTLRSNKTFTGTQNILLKLLEDIDFFDRYARTSKGIFEGYI